MRIVRESARLACLFAVAGLLVLAGCTKIPTPEQGGARTTLMNGGFPAYYYECGSSPPSACVVSELKDGHLVFFHLDPLKGTGEEVARIDGYQSPIARWDLSPDGARIAIVDPKSILTRIAAGAQVYSFSKNS